MQAVEIQALTKLFAGRPAVDGLSLTVAAGETVGLVGPNGAGKTTTLRILAGLVRPTSGDVHVFERRVRLGSAMAGLAGAVVDRPALIPHLSGDQNLEVFARVAGISMTRTERAEAIRRVGLDPGDRRPTRAYSTGMRQRLAIATALLPSPRLLVLDEPTNGLDPSGIADLRQLLVDLGGAGTTILLSSHLLGEVERICTRVAIIVRGRVLAEGAPSEIAPTARSARVGFADLGTASAAAGVARSRGIGAQQEGPEVRLDLPPEELGEALCALAAAGLLPTSVIAGRASLEDVYRRYVDATEIAKEQ